MSSPSALLYVLTSPKPSLSHSNFNEWYDTVHLKDVLSPPGAPTLGLRFKHIDPSAAFPYLALYPLEDLGYLQTDGPKTIPMTHELLGESGEFSKEVDAELRVYVKIQELEGVDLKDGRPKAVVIVHLEPAEGGDEELDEWYRKQHLDMLSMLPICRRSTRYKLIDPDGTSNHPRYLAIHEIDSTEVPKEVLEIVNNTEWSKKVLGEAKIVIRDIWKFMYEYGNKEEKL